MEAPDRTGQTWQIRSVNATRVVFLVVGPPVRRGVEWMHPVLILRNDMRPDRVGVQSTTIEPRVPQNIDDEPGPWEHETGMTRIA